MPKRFMESSPQLRGGLMLMMVGFFAIPIVLISYQLDHDNGIMVSLIFGALCTLGALVAFVLSSLLPGQEGAVWAMLFSGFCHTGPVLITALILSRLDEMWKGDAAIASLLAFYLVTLFTKTLFLLPNFQDQEEPQ